VVYDFFLYFLPKSCDYKSLQKVPANKNNNNNIKTTTTTQYKNQLESKKIQKQITHQSF